jgi:AcrR family transcriptional regulator
MQRPDDKKRQAILDAAGSLFGKRPYHEVRLDDVAEIARVGKGTVYIYFKGKDDLYGALLHDGFAQLLDRVRKHTADESTSAWDTLSRVVREFVGWAKTSPHLFHLMRAGNEMPPVPRLREKRRELGKLIEQILVRGVKAGEFDDPRPDLTAQFIPSCVRGVLRHGPADVGVDALSNQILRVIGGGIRRNK